MNKIALSVLLALASLQASAGFEVVEAPAKAPVPVVKKEAVALKTVKAKKPGAEMSMDEKMAAVAVPSVLHGGITHVGRKPAIIGQVKGFGKGVTLKDALGMIVPETYHVYNDGQINLSKAVSWSAADGNDWTSVLDVALRNAQISATLNWNDNSLTLDKQDIVVPMIVSKPEWLMTSRDKTVKTALGRWAKTSGWNLDWDVAVDFPVPYDVAFRGDFETAVQDVMSSLAGSDYPLEACSYENKTMRIVRFGESKRCNLQR